jgi:N-acetyltransferase 10
LTPFDAKRLESYANNMLDYHVIIDMLPTIATLYFEGRMTASTVQTASERQDLNVQLSPVQAAILLSLGLQRKTIEDVEVCFTLSLHALSLADS